MFGREKLRWYLFGAQAVIVHGHVRQSADVDVTVELGSMKPAALLKRLEAFGFKLLIDEAPARFIAETRVIPVEHLRTHIPVDVVIAGPGLEQDILARVHRIKVAGANVPVVSPEDLIVLKLLAGRSRDLDDVRGVITRQGDKLDVAAVRERVGAVEALLDQSDLTPILEELLSVPRKHRTATGPRPRAKRGKPPRARKKR